MKDRLNKLNCILKEMTAELGSIKDCIQLVLKSDVSKKALCEFKESCAITNESCSMKTTKPTESVAMDKRCVKLMNLKNLRSSMELKVAQQTQKGNDGVDCHCCSKKNEEVEKHVCTFSGKNQEFDSKS